MGQDELKELAALNKYWNYPNNYPTASELIPKQGTIEGEALTLGMMQNVEDKIMGGNGPALAPAPNTESKPCTRPTHSMKDLYKGTSFDPNSPRHLKWESGPKDNIKWGPSTSPSGSPSTLADFLQAYEAKPDAAGYAGQYYTNYKPGYPNVTATTNAVAGNQANNPYFPFPYKQIDYSWLGIPCSKAEYEAHLAIDKAEYVAKVKAGMLKVAAPKLNYTETDEHQAAVDAFLASIPTMNKKETKW